MLISFFAAYRLHISIISGFFQGSEGNALLHKFGMATESLDPGHTYVPWVVVDGDSSGITSSSTH